MWLATAVSPGAINVIPGNTRFTIDVRSGDDGTRRSAVEDIESGIEAICARRGATVQVKRLRESKSCPCAPWLLERTAAAIEAEGIPGRRPQSGAGPGRHGDGVPGERGHAVRPLQRWHQP